MTAATHAVWSGQAGRDVAFFFAAQLILHLAFGMVAWCVAWATTVLFPPASQRFGRVVLLWFCVLVAAVIAYNAVWYPWTGLGEYYHNALAAPLGPLAIGRVFYLVVVSVAALTLLSAGSKKLRRLGHAGLRLPLGIGGGLLAVVLVSALGTVHEPSKVPSGQRRPNIILIGSTRCASTSCSDLVAGESQSILDRFLAKADIVRDTTTPSLGRTRPGVPF